MAFSTIYFTYFTSGNVCTHFNFTHTSESEIKLDVNICFTFIYSSTLS